jgi:hypothetical protein
MPPRPHKKPAKQRLVRTPKSYKGRKARVAPEKRFPNGKSQSETTTCIHNQGKTGLKVGG